CVGEFRGQLAHRGEVVPDVLVELWVGRISTGDVHGIEHDRVVSSSRVPHHVHEVVVSAAIFDDHAGLGQGQLVLGGGLVGVRILVRVVDYRGHQYVVAPDLPGDVPVDVRRGHDPHRLAGCGCRGGVVRVRAASRQCYQRGDGSQHDSGTRPDERPWTYGSAGGSPPPANESRIDNHVH